MITQDSIRIYDISFCIFHKIDQFSPNSLDRIQYYQKDSKDEHASFGDDDNDVDEEEGEG